MYPESYGIGEDAVGIVVVLVLYFTVLSILAIVCSAVLVAAIRWYVRSVPEGRKGVLSYAALLPFACVIYAGIWFIAYAAINESLLHQDPMLGDGWHSNIGHGYAIDMIDVTDQGTVHPTEGPENGLNSADGISGVRRMQVSGSLIFGSEDKDWFPNLGKDSSEESSFFVIDTQTHAHKEFSSEPALAAYAKQRGITIVLRPIADVCSAYRKTWFDIVAGIILLGVPAFALWRLVRRVFMLKRDGVAHSKC